MPFLKTLISPSFLPFIASKNKKLFTHLAGCQQFLDLFFTHSWFFGGSLKNLFVEHLFNILLGPPTFIIAENSHETIWSSCENIFIFVKRNSPYRARKWNVLKTKRFWPYFQHSVLTSWYVISQSKCFCWKNEGRMTQKCLDGFEISTPKLNFLVIWASNNHSWPFNFWDFSDNITMCIFNPLDLVSSLPVPNIQCFILRSTHHIIWGRIEEDRNCIFMLSILTNVLLSRQIPNNSLTIPWACHNVVAIDKINRRDSAIVYYFQRRISVSIEHQNLSIPASKDNKERRLILIPIDFDCHDFWIDDSFGR